MPVIAANHGIPSSAALAEGGKAEPVAGNLAARQTTGEDFPP